MPLTRFCGIIILSLHLILSTSHCNGGNILVFPVDGSHWINMKILLEELHARGHNISVIRSSTSWYIPEKSHLFDQYDNLLRLQERGAAKIIQLADVNSHTFEKNIKELLYKVSYRQNMQRLSSLHRDQPMPPMDQATFWVEYVMRHKGAPHLRTEAYKMPWYSYYCLDVLIFLVTSVTMLLLLVFAIAKFLCCTRKNSKTKVNFS